MKRFLSSLLETWNEGFKFETPKEMEMGEALKMMRLKWNERGSFGLMSHHDLFVKVVVLKWTFKRCVSAMSRRDE